MIQVRLPCCPQASQVPLHSSTSLPLPRGMLAFTPFLAAPAERPVGPAPKLSQNHVSTDPFQSPASWFQPAISHRQEAWEGMESSVSLHKPCHEAPCGIHMDLSEPKRTPRACAAPRAQPGCQLQVSFPPPLPHHLSAAGKQCEGRGECSSVPSSPVRLFARVLLGSVSGLHVHHGVLYDRVQARTKTPPFLPPLHCLPAAERCL